ncbi:hypothetical protein [Pectinatus haikarae]|uniref:Uncharacterized protein n=1 Tax=Pectinatus haikarae TaxID=349096 RepID=A0ABT9Y3R2_9FIRM|nr:hypothetical protein [Pectinatus haikarae]MDQ0202462.1 hypothetical protein [Pectinatus haikarae]
MSEDSIRKLFDKIDDFGIRLARIETILDERDKAKKSYTATIAWCITTAIAVYAAVHK